MESPTLRWHRLLVNCPNCGREITEHTPAQTFVCAEGHVALSCTCLNCGTMFNIRKHRFEIIDFCQEQDKVVPQDSPTFDNLGKGEEERRH